MRKNKKINKNWLLIIALLFLALILNGCASGPFTRPSNPGNEDYFTGSEGIRMQFEPGSPPPRFFYHSGEENTFDMTVRVENVGASDTIGALYISGFSPNLIEIEGTNIKKQTPSDCVFDITNLRFDSGKTNIGLFFSCMGTDVSFQGLEDWNVNLRNIGERLGIPALGDLNINYQGGNFGLSLGWDAFGGLEVLNHGRALIAVLSGINFKNYNGYPFDEIGVLKGRNYQNPTGDMYYQHFRGKISNNWPPGLDETNVDFLITACYGYTTYAAPKICIDPRPYDYQREKVCTPQLYKSLGSQGAPVAITSIKQEPTDRSIFFTFTIKNIGRGTVFNPGYLERCSPYFPGRLDGRHLNTVYVGDIRIGRQRLECNDYQVRLNDAGEGQFTCEYKLEYATASSAYYDTLVVELWYGYSESIRSSMHIKRVS